MAVAFRSSSIASASSDADLVFNKPTGMLEGDMMVAFCLRRRDGSSVGIFNTPSGWDNINTQTITNDVSVTTFAKIATSGDAAASTFSFTPQAAGDDSAGAFVAVSGNSFGSVAGNVVDNSGTSSGTSLSYSGLTPMATNPLLLMFIGNQDALVDVAFSGYAVTNNNPSWTEDRDVVVGSNTINYALAYATYASSSATGNFLATASASADYIGVLVSVNESINVTVNADPLVITGVIPDASVSGDANVTVDPLVITGTIPNATVTITNPDWLNGNKSDSNWTNQDKS